MSLISELSELPLIAPRISLPAKDRRDRSRQDRRADPRRALLEPEKLQRKDRRSKDRRATGRIEVSLDVEELKGDTFRTFDLSTFGVSTIGGPAYTVGTRLQLQINLTDGEDAPVSVDAEVVGWLAESKGMRLAFRKPSVEAVRRIHKFITRKKTSAANRS